MPFQSVEAGWTGDNASIQEFCLPKHLSEGKVPIQISVHTTLSGSLAGLNGMPQSMPSQRPSCRQFYPGWTPFLVALHRRHWETARLVIAIATAQYQPPDAEATPSPNVLSGCKYRHITTFSLGSLILHVSDDSDERGYDSDEDDDHDDYSDEQEINFIDLAARPSAIRTEVSASRMLQLAHGVLLETDGKRDFCNPLQKAVREDDLEVFVRTLELY